MERLIKKTKPMTEFVAKIIEPEMSKASGAFHIALVALFVIAMRWPDVDLPGNLLRGFKIVGTIPSSGVFKQVEVQNADDPAELLKDNERKLAEWSSKPPPKHW